MTRSKTSAALIVATAVGAFAALPAQAASRHTQKPSIADRNRSDPDSPQKGDWENRNPFYRGPTYIGRY